MAVGATDYWLLLHWFGSVRQIAVYRNDYRWMLEGPLPIYLCTQPRAYRSRMMWPALKILRSIGLGKLPRAMKESLRLGYEIALWKTFHAERSAGWSVLCYVAVLVVATFLTNGMPSLDVQAYRRSAGDRLASVRSALGGAWLTFPGRRVLSLVPGRPAQLPQQRAGAPGRASRRSHSSRAS